MERDRRTRDALLEGGWRVAVIWECALRAELTEITARTLDHWLRGCEREFETGIELVAAIRGATRPSIGAVLLGPPVACDGTYGGGRRLKGKVV